MQNKKESYSLGVREELCVEINNNLDIWVRKFNNKLLIMRSNNESNRT